jgi:hypothetical protein
MPASGQLIKKDSIIDTNERKLSCQLCNASPIPYFACKEVGLRYLHKQQGGSMCKVHHLSY